MKKLVLLVGLAIAGLVLALVLKSEHPSNTSRLEKEQEVYSVLFGSEKFEVEEHTTLGNLSHYSKKDFENTLNNLHGVQRETIVDFQENNRQPELLKKYLPLQTDDFLLSPSDQLLDKDGWVAVSQIGFNSDFNQALILWWTVVKNETNSSYCDGIFYLLHKEDDAWLFQDQFWVFHCSL